jgi:2-keto-4-pentenoate hydratase/2-oxohepta-3-ene-1,7-dioic acid hydratase in catechol pathway
VAACIAAGTFLTAQEVTPFKVGTFERQGKPFVGVVLRDAYVIDLAAAATATKTAGQAPTDMKDLITRYDSGVRNMIIAVVKAAGDPARSGRPGYIHDVKSIKTLPPIMYPMTVMNAAVNYYEHAAEGQNAPPPGAVQPGYADGKTVSAPGLWDRKAGDKRWNPYLFLKATSAIIGEGETIRIPQGRERIDWECEMGVVIGKVANHVPVDRAKDYIFGYTLEMDVSDRGGRGDGRHGSDWLIGKSHDTFAPMGPYIVPKEFIADPQKLKITFTLDGKVMQDSNTSEMIHTVYEMVHFGTNILTLRPGDIIATGSPAGVGNARKPPIYLKAGQTSVCTYEGVGTLTNPIGMAQAPATSAAK